MRGKEGGECGSGKVADGAAWGQVARRSAGVPRLGSGLVLISLVLNLLQ